MNNTTLPYWWKWLHYIWVFLIVIITIPVKKSGFIIHDDAGDDDDVIHDDDDGDDDDVIHDDGDNDVTPDDDDDDDDDDNDHVKWINVQCQPLKCQLASFYLLS